MKKRLVSIILSAALLATSVPVSAFAEETSDSQMAVTQSEQGQSSQILNESSIDYKKNGGTFAEKPWRAGYTFAGWYTDAGLTAAFDGVIPDHDITLYAKWEAQQVSYKVLHYLENANDDGKTLILQENLKAETDSKVTPKVQKFTGFESPKEESAQISGEVTTVVKYYYKRTVHTATFKPEDGGKDVVITGRYGTKITAPTLSRTGYQFLDWDQEVESTIPADQDLTYTAQWKRVEYTLQFKTDEGTDIAPIKGYYGDKVKAPEDPERTGYVFAGWYENGKKVDKLPTTMPEGNHIYTASWTVETYKITYDLNGGNMKNGETNPATYDVNTVVFKLKNPVRDGYTFTGWSGTGIDRVEKNVSVTQNSTGNRSYKANWEENTYQIQFLLSGEGATGSMARKTVKYTEKVKLPKCEFTNKGHSFVRWYSVDSKKKKTYYSDMQEVTKLTGEKNGVVTLYPEWKANIITDLRIQAIHTG